MSTIDELRGRIDAIDAEVVKLIGERIRTAETIGQEKKKSGKQIEDVEREKRVIEGVRRIATRENLNPEVVEKIYRQVIAVTKRTEEVQVAFQGESGAYSEQAAIDFFGAPHTKTHPCESFDDVFRSVERQEVDFGMIPIENSLEGSVSQTYDLLLDSNLKVCGETELRVSHCLIANPGVTLGAIKRVFSHPQALGQSKRFLKQLNCLLVPTYDTAGSVKMIKEQCIMDGAAIASARAAEIYGMTILARELEDNTNNYTRFFILSHQDARPTGNDKTSVVFAVKHTPGTLYSVLNTFNQRKVNLTKIESRPTRQKPWEYNFYLDFEGHREDAQIQSALEELQQFCIFVKILGSYPKQNR